MRRSLYLIAVVALAIAAGCDREQSAASSGKEGGAEVSEEARQGAQGYGTGGDGGIGGVGAGGGIAGGPARGRPGSRSETDMAMPAAPPAPAPAPSAIAQDPSVSAVDRVGSAADAGGTGTIVPSMLIRTGNATVEVDSLEIAVAAVRLLATRLGGYVANTAMQTGSEELRSASLELKIPAARFDEAISGLQPLGKVAAVNVSTADVGEEFVDVTARVENAKRLEDRLITLLATRTGRLEDVLQVERELARVREEIERYDGRLRYLRTRAAVSTLTVTVHEPQPIVGRYEGATPIADAFRAMWRNLVGFVAGLIAALGWLVPIGLILAGAWWILRRAGLFSRGEDDGAVRLPRTARGPRRPLSRAPEEPASTDGEV